MNAFILVFYLGLPENLTIYEKYNSELLCKQAEIIWNKRLTQVNSKIKAECRENKEIK